MEKLVQIKNKAVAKVQSGARQLASKMHGDSQIVVALVLIAVAIGLCIIFKDSISKTMGNLFNIISTSIDNLSKGL